VRLHAALLIKAFSTGVLCSVAASSAKAGFREWMGELDGTIICFSMALDGLYSIRFGLYAVLLGRDVYILGTGWWIVAVWVTWDSWEWDAAWRN
jgi:hypothetical protein